MLNLHTFCDLQPHFIGPSDAPDVDFSILVSSVQKKYCYHQQHQRFRCDPTTATRITAVFEREQRHCFTGDLIFLDRSNIPCCLLRSDLRTALWWLVPEHHENIIMPNSADIKIARSSVQCSFCFKMGLRWPKKVWRRKKGRPQATHIVAPSVAWIF